MNSSARRSGVPASSRAAARISSSVAEASSSVSASVNGLASRCTNRWPELVRSTSKSARSATTSGRTVMRLSLRWDALAAAAKPQPSPTGYPDSQVVITLTGPPAGRLRSGGSLPWREVAAGEARKKGQHGGEQGRPGSEGHPGAVVADRDEPVHVQRLPERLAGHAVHAKRKHHAPQARVVAQRHPADQVPPHPEAD